MCPDLEHIVVQDKYCDMYYGIWFDIKHDDT